MMTTPRALGLLSLGTLAGALVCGSWAYAAHGLAGTAATATAAVVCWVGAVIALVLLERSRGTHRAVYAVLGGMLIRLTLPILAAIFLPSRAPLLAEGALLGQIVVFYLLTLALETLLAARMLNTSSKSPAGCS